MLGIWQESFEGNPNNVLATNQWRPYFDKALLQQVTGNIPIGCLMTFVPSVQNQPALVAGIRVRGPGAGGIVRISRVASTEITS